MTGFGLGEARLGPGRVCTEIRSLNHRFLELRVRLPDEIGDQTFFVEQLCRGRLRRGRHDVSVRLDGGACSPVEVDLDRARRAYRAFERLRDELAPGTPLPISVLAGFPGVFGGPARPDSEPVRAALAASVEAAVAALEEMRATEGSALQNELSTRLHATSGLLAQLSQHAPGLAAAQHRRLKERLSRLLGSSDGLDEGRLAMELAVLADRSDFTEELVRLRSHVEQFGELLSAPGPSGRKLDFLLQEMGRETNTVGAKCQDATVSHLVVALKAEVERLREQVQNVE